MIIYQLIKKLSNMDKETRTKVVYTTLRYVVEILTILGVLSAIGCTTVFTTSKKGGGTQSVTITTEQTVSVDSTKMNFKIK